MQKMFPYHFFRLNPVNITIIYLVLGFLWIAFSDRMVESLVEDPAALTRIQTIKGWFYVAVTGVLLYLLIQRYSRSITRLRQNIVDTFDRYKALLEHANQIIIQVDGQQRFIYTNPVIEEFLGYGEDELMDMDALEAIVHDSDRVRFREIRGMLGEPAQKQIKHQIRLRPRNGNYRWFLFIAMDERRLKHLESRLLIIRDIHDETLLYEQLKESNRRFEHLFQEAPVGYHSLNSEMKFIDINKTELEILGYERNDVVGKMSWGDVIIPEEKDKYERHVKELQETGNVENYMYTLVCKDGSRRSVILNAKAFFNGNDRLEYTLGNVVDITEKERVEKERDEAYRRLNYHIQNSPLGFVEWDYHFRVKEWSAGSENMFEWKKEEVEGKHPDEWDFVYPDDKPYINQIMSKLLDGSQTRNVAGNRNLTKNGKVLHCEWYNSALLDEDGNLISIMSLVHDITEQVKAREEVNKLNESLEKKVMQRTQELEAANKELESFAYSVSHDLRAPLRGIDGFSQALVEQYEEKLDEQGVRYLDRVRAATRKMGALIDDILALSRISRQKINMEQIDLAAVSREIFATLQEKEPDKQAQLSVPEELVVTGDPNLMHILMQNLLENAWKFSSHRSKITVEIGTELSKGQKELSKGQKVVYVRDYGAGFNMNYYNKLFMAFQRLHSLDEFPGTGIGLATVQRIIERHSGTIWAESREGEGSIFYFKLPEKRV